MTHYDKLIDSIVSELYEDWQYHNSNKWNENEAKQRAHKILTLVEEFQSKRTRIS